MSVYSLQGRIDKAIIEGEKGLVISPNSANLNLLFGNTLSIAGRHEEAISRVRKSMRLNPHHQPAYFGILGICYFRASMNEKAIEYLEKNVQLAPQTLRPWLELASIYAQLGRDEKAKKAAKEVHRIAPDYTWEKYGKPFIFTDQEVERRFFNGLQKVGLK